MKPKIEKTLRLLPDPWAEFVNSPELHMSMHSRRFYDNAKISDHHAIVPTDKKADTAKLSPDEYKLYDMIARRLIAAHYPYYEYESARIVTRVKGHDFRSTGAMPLVEGWRALYRGDKPDKNDKAEPQLPRLSEGDTRKVQKAMVKACKTKPPAPHTDASLLDLMENAGRSIEDEALREQMKSSGLGTPATRAATIERLIQVGYAARRGKTIVSTEKGRQLIAVVPEQIASAVTTGKWEKFLSDMANQQDEAARDQKSRRFMSGIRKFSVFLVDAAKAAPAGVQFEREAAGAWSRAKKASRPRTGKRKTASKKGKA